MESNSTVAAQKVPFAKPVPRDAVWTRHLLGQRRDATAGSVAAPDGRVRLAANLDDPAFTQDALVRVEIAPLP
jgi:hypothetical protein